MDGNDAYGGIDNLEIMKEARNYNRYLLETVLSRTDATARILDFGAGAGQFAIPLAGAGLDVTALEPDQKLRHMLLAKGIRAIAAPSEVPDQSFEYIYTLNVLEHIPDDVGALQQLRSKLSTEGTLLIYVPAFPLLFTSMDAKVGHVRRYTRTSLVDAVTKAGLRVERVAYVDCLGFVATLIFKLVGNTQGQINPRALKLYDRLIFPLSRALDLVAGRWLGKNVLLIARTTSKPVES